MSVNEVKRAPPPPALLIHGSSLHSRTYAIGSEDHTLGNSLRHILLVGLSGKVSFAGYSVPHPSEEVVQLRVQLRKDKNVESTSDGGSKVDDVVVEGCNALMGVCDLLTKEILKTSGGQARAGSQRMMDERGSVEPM